MATDIDIEWIANGNLKFATKFYNQFSKNKTNVVFSPLGVHNVLSMVHQGSNEETEKQLAETLNIPNKNAGANGYNMIMNFLNNLEDVTFHIANKIYIKKNCSLKTTFEEVVSKLFLSEIESVNFDSSTETADKINEWVEKRTDSNIKDIISRGSLKSDSQLLLIDAVCFKSKWQQGFVKHATRIVPFFITNIEKIDCHMMYVNRSFKYNKFNDDLDAEILELPYMNENVSMVIILPKSNDGIANLENKLMKVDFSILTKSMIKVRVKVHLPKFKIESTLDMKPLLKEVGTNYKAKA